jgi:carbamoylphosphate synthase small subunit
MGLQARQLAVLQSRFEPVSPENEAEVLTNGPGRAMVQAVNRQHLIVEARIRIRISSFGICFGQSGTGTGFTSVLTCHYCSTVALDTHISLGI